MTAYYRSEVTSRLIDVDHDIEELYEIDGLIERGPSWHALDHIDIRLNSPETKTIEQTERE